MKTRVVGPNDLATIVDTVGLDELLDQLIERLTITFHNYDPEVVDARSRDGYSYIKPDLGLIEWMPTMESGGMVVIKMVGYHPTNPVQRGLPSVLATTSMWDTSSGHLLAISEATFLTAIRTAASSAIATDLLTPTGANILGLIGCGAQAVTQAHAISRIRPIERIMAFDTNLEVAESLAERLDFLNIEIEVVESEQLANLVAKSTIICTCTSVDIGAGPVFIDGPKQPGLHINAVGADFHGKTELPLGLLEQAYVVPDEINQCLAEGESQQLSPDNVGPQLFQLIQDTNKNHNNHRSRLSVFDSTGWAVEDKAAMELILEHSESLGLGTDIEIESSPSDPYNPYSTLVVSQPD